VKWLTLALSLAISISAYAGIGSVTESSGTAIIKRGKTTVTVAVGTEVEQDDRVETKNGKVKIKFKDDTTVSVTESSALVIDDFVYDPKNMSGGKLALRAASGTVRYVSGNIAHNNPNAVNIKTPTAAVAVRGTDFVMSVNEVGSSLIMLMPSCETSQIVSVGGKSCGSGAIDVTTSSGTVNMDRPYQATFVETSGQAPSPPVFVNLSINTIGNLGLQVATPTIMGGGSVISAARQAAAKTGDIQDNKDDSKDSEKQQVVSKQDSNSRDQKKNEEVTETKILVNSDAVANQVAAVGDTENPYIKKLFKDKSQTQQIAWMYESLSPSQYNYANVILPMNTQVQVIVTQDMVTNGYNFSSGKAQGQIVINQVYR
jgi:hypothetical protein